MLLSDQLLAWSDENIEADHRRLAKAPPSAPARHCGKRYAPPWLGPTSPLVEVYYRLPNSPAYLGLRERCHKWEKGLF